MEFQGYRESMMSTCQAQEIKHKLYTSKILFIKMKIGERIYQM